MSHCSSICFKWEIRKLIFRCTLKKKPHTCSFGSMQMYMQYHFLALFDNWMPRVKSNDLKQSVVLLNWKITSCPPEKLLESSLFQKKWKCQPSLGISRQLAYHKWRSMDVKRFGSRPAGLWVYIVFQNDIKSCGEGGSVGNAQAVTCSLMINLCKQFGPD